MTITHAKPVHNRLRIMCLLSVSCLALAATACTPSKHKLCEGRSRERLLASSQRVAWLDVEGGTLDGENRGEWGGGLTFTSDSGLKQTLLKDNVVGIEEFGGFVVAAAGRRHMSEDRGALYKVALDAGKWKATEWLSLPGAPQALVVREGRLVVHRRGEMVMISAAGEMERVSCL